MAGQLADRSSHVGLIRKSLALGSAGVIRPSSKKQRVAKKTLNATRDSAKASKQTAKTSKQIAASSAAAAGQAAILNKRLDEQAAIEHQFRYDTDPTYRQWVDGREAAATALAAEQAAVAAAARAAAIEAKAVPVWQEGERVVITQLGYRGKPGAVVKQGRMGCTIRLDDGKVIRAVDARKLERAPDA